MMLDDFRNADDGIFQEEETAPEQEAASQPQAGALGMTPVQRFVLVVMFFFSIFLLGTVCLLITQRIWLPF